MRAKAIAFSGLLALALLFSAAPAHAQTVYVVAGCTVYQIQCWVYPTLVLGFFGGFFYALAAAGRVSHKGQIYMVLCGLTYGSLIGILIGVMPFFVPLLLILGNVFYSLKLGQRIVEAVRNR